jgi:hypothetical protein
MRENFDPKLTVSPLFARQNMRAPPKVSRALDATRSLMGRGRSSPSLLKLCRQASAPASTARPPQRKEGVVLGVQSPSGTDVVTRSRCVIRRANFALVAVALAFVSAGCNSGKDAQQQPPPPLVRAERYSSDSFSPAETLAASSVAIIGSPTNTGRADALEPRYRVLVEKVVFNVAPRNISSPVIVFGGNVLRLRDNETVTLALSPSSEDTTSFEFTTRVSAIGFLREHNVDFRSIDGGLVTIPIAPDSSVGCFASANPAPGCRTALLARFGIRSPRQQRVYDELLRANPGGGVMWIHAYRRTHAAFPDWLCSRIVTDHCASAQAFFKAAQLDLKV